MSYKRWSLLFLLLGVILAHVVLLQGVMRLWVSMPGLIGAALIIFFAEFIAFFFSRIIYSERWPLAIRIFGWALLLLNPITLLLRWFTRHVLGFIYG